jgi:hypothetical protein
VDRVEFGPEFKFLARLIAERGLKPVIACETPNLDVDALKLRDMVMREMKIRVRG